MAPKSSLQEMDQRLADLGVDPQELEEKFVRAGGPGGQHVNRTSTAVQLSHPPSGVSVRAEGERSQLQNRIAAREQLIQRILKARQDEEAARVAAREKRRRQNRQRPAGVKRRMLEQKRRRGQVKKRRGRVQDEE